MSTIDKLRYGYDPLAAGGLRIVLCNAEGDFAHPEGERFMKRLLKKKNPVAADVFAERVRRQMGILPLAYTGVSNDE